MNGPPFKPGKFYIHKNALDVCIEIVRFRFIGDTCSVWYVRRWNLGYTGNPWCIDSVKNYRIDVPQYDNYREITEDELRTPRKI